MKIQKKLFFFLLFYLALNNFTIFDSAFRSMNGLKYFFSKVFGGFLMIFNALSKMQVFLKVGKKYYEIRNYSSNGLPVSCK